MRASLALVAFSLTVVFLPARAVIVETDEFSIIKNGNTTFDDAFNNNAPPPSAPNFSDGSPASYAVTGSFPADAEASGRLRMNSANGAAVVNANGTVNRSQSATLLTNSDPNNLVNGLKVDDTFSVTGVFNLVPLSGPLYSGYGIGLLDGNAASPKQNEWNLQLQWSQSLSQNIIRFSWQDFDADTITTLGYSLLDAPDGADAIVFRLSRPDLESFDLVASFAYLDGETVSDWQTFQQFGSVFQDKNWVRGFFFAASTDVPEPATLALVMLALLGTAYARTSRRR